MSGVLAVMKNVGVSALGLPLAALLALAAHQTGPLLAYRRLQDPAWSRSASPKRPT